MGIFMNRLVLFDIDKTLLMGSKVHYTALKNAVSEVYKINPSPVENLQGMTDLKIIYTILSQEGMDLKTIKSGLDECMELMYLKYKDALQRKDLIVLVGVKQLLETLKRKKIPMGLVTGNTEAIAWLKLEKTGLKKYFKFGGFGDHVMKRSSIVKKALEASVECIGTMERENIFLVGDTPRDILGGHKMGLITIGVATGDFSRDQLLQSGADFILENLKDTDKVLKIILKT